MKTRTPLKAGDEVFVKGGTQRVAVRRLQTNGVVELAEPMENQLYWPSEMLERCDPTLGDMLAQIMQKQGETTQDTRRTEPWQRRERGEREAFLTGAAESIERDIREGQIPEIEIASSALNDWLSSCAHHGKMTVDFDLYTRFSRRLETQGIAFNKTLRDNQMFISVAPLGGAS